MEQAKPVARRRHDAQLKCVFRPIVTVDFGIVTAVRRCPSAPGALRRSTDPRGLRTLLVPSRPERNDDRPLSITKATAMRATAQASNSRLSASSRVALADGLDDGLKVGEFVEQIGRSAGGQRVEHLMGFLDELQAEQPRHFLGAGDAHRERAPLRRRDGGDAVADQLLSDGRSSSQPCRERSSARHRADQAGRRRSAESGECADGRWSGRPPGRR